MWRFIGSMLGLVYASVAPAFEVKPFYENGKVGLKNEAGQVLVPARYDALGWSDGSFSVNLQHTGYLQNGRWGLLHIQKSAATAPVFDALTPAGAAGFVAARAINPFTVKYGLIDAAEKIRIPFHYDGLRVSGLRAIVFIKNGSRYEHGLITLDDRRIIPLQFKSIEPIGTLRYAVQNFENKVALFTETGEALTGFSIDSMGAFHYNHAVIHQNLRQGLTDRTGNIVVAPTYRAVYWRGEWRGQPYPVWEELSHSGEPLQSFEADTLQPAGRYLLTWQAGHAGALTPDGKTFLPVQYQHLAHTPRFWVARRAGKFGLLHADGRECLPFRFDTLAAENDFVRAAERPWGEVRWSLYDTLGTRKTEKYYRQIGPMKPYGFVAQWGDFFGILDRRGVEQVACVYDSILEIADDNISVKFKGLYGIISPDDRWLLTPQPHRIKLLRESCYLLYDTIATFVKHLNGRVIYFSNGALRWTGAHLVETLPGLPDRYIGIDGRELKTSAAPADFTSVVYDEREGLRGIRRDGRFGFIDTRGKLRIANRYEGIGFFSEGLAPVKIMGRWGFVNTKDQVAINPSFDTVTEFSNGRALAARQGRWGVIDKTGTWILQPRYDAVRALPQGRYLLETRNLRGLATRDGNVLIEPRFETLALTPLGDVMVSQEGRYGVLSEDGFTKIPLLYDALIFRPATNTFLARRRRGEEILTP
jgi:hypothetical protein